MNASFKIIYHGECLDGISSAALLAYFLNQIGITKIKFQGVSYPFSLKWWRNLKPKELLAVLDFRYHPKANIWLDHHESTFTFPYWRKQYKPKFFSFYDPSAPSTTGLLYRFLKKNFNFFLNQSWQNYIEKVDICDSFSFSNYQSIVKARNLAFKLFLLLKEKKDLENRLTQLLFRKQITEINQMISKDFSNLQKKIQKLLVKISQSSQLISSVIALDLFPEKNNNLVQILSFFLYPEKKYLWLSWWENGYYHFRIYFNSIRYSIKRSNLHLGLLMQKLFKTGGGHKGVGAGQVKSKEKLMKIKEEILSKIS